MRYAFLPLSLLLATPVALNAQAPAYTQTGYPQYCCTPAGRFGPFYNGMVTAGERCSAVDTAGVRHVGGACYGAPSPLTIGPMDTTGYARSCCTDIGVLGPFPGVNWQEGAPCAAIGVDDQRHEGTACYSVDHALERASRDGRLLAAAAAGCPNAPRDVSARTVLAVARPASPARAPRTGSR
ncbi:MAG TPA: hypothetical protein VFW66_05255 [Gemmatimonadales bacterium]|nr:hypothetical protein [Gemmatimonadales bacterium]